MLSFVGAGIGVLIAGLMGFVGVFFVGFGGTLDDRPVQTLVAITFGMLLGALLLIVGAILLLMRRRAGRVVAVAGAAVTFVGVVTATVMLDDNESTPWILILWALVPLATIVFALLPATGRWCRR